MQRAAWFDPEWGCDVVHTHFLGGAVQCRIGRVCKNDVPCSAGWDDHDLGVWIVPSENRWRGTNPNPIFFWEDGYLRARMVASKTSENGSMGKVDPYGK